ncbi:MgtC/SapB family protein [Ornithinibacillus sp. BX22]|uniref:MgtC/SapB family protein n=2 Tax=Ornithinibacillus TaxID=484508 RepID=A0A923L8K7_9BACI|nr:MULTISPECIES: MgtC/SapB family protein [Ornithinibacillus]MBC5638521.1 MgtC/SapB family protein [Ornithinibacillus hominis]MBS3682205.1 MgtC/SapB family protein [Ornithinibacillus massiliensis]
MNAVFENLIDDNFLLIIARVLIALVLSGLIGFERELKNHSAGFRTHILVGVGACLMMLLSLFGFEAYIEKYNNVQFDPARIPSYVISGIGFLGAGTIMVYGGTIRGLTTAASIWAVAGLGLVVGAGMYAVAVFTTLIILLSLVFLNNFEKLFTRGKTSLVLEIISYSGLPINKVVSVLEDSELKVRQVEVIKVENDLKSIFIKVERKANLNKIELFERLSSIDAVKSVSER